MPRTRNELDREAKVAEIVAAAERRLREGGYEALSVAAIARELGLAQNAIYWYFPSKDYLFVAALQQILRDIAARKPSGEVSKIERILWFADQLETMADLRGAMNARAPESEVVAEFVEELEALLSRMLTSALRDQVAAEDLPVAVETVRATVQGAYARGLDRQVRRKMLTFALERIVGKQK